MIYLIGLANLLIVSALLAIKFQEAGNQFIANVFGISFAIIFIVGLIIFFIFKDKIDIKE